MRRTAPVRGIHRTYLAILGGAAVVAALGLAFMASLAGTSAAATAEAPVNTVEPRITGTPRVGEVLTTTRGTWTSVEPANYAFRWYRCDGRGRPDASDCDRISNATNASYEVRRADAGSRIRSQVVATNLDGSTTATSNPTNVVQTAAPVNTEAPSISGSTVVGNRLTANPGTWTGIRPMSFAFQWLRCNEQGEGCAVIAGATDNSYVLAETELGRTIRVRVTAENARGRTAKRTAATAVVTRTTPAPPPPGSSVPVEDLKAAGDRLVVSQVRFSPNPVTSRTEPITAQVRVTARQGRPVRGALVFMRATPRVVQGQTAATGEDGWVTLQLVPNRLFPQPRNGFNVQFFVKAFRRGDPGLGGIAGYRLVQVPLAG
jgi:hypothetical protein